MTASTDAHLFVNANLSSYQSSVLEIFSLAHLLTLNTDKRGGKKSWMSNEI